MLLPALLLNIPPHQKQNAEFLRHDLSPEPYYVLLTRKNLQKKTDALGAAKFKRARRAYQWNRDFRLSGDRRAWDK